MKRIITLLLIIASQSVFSQGFNSVHTKDGISVWAAGNSGLVFYSHNSGQNWLSFTLGASKLNSVFAIHNKVVIAGDNGSIFLSNNGGAGFNLYTAGSQHLNSICFADNNNGWAVGNAGVIYMTNNGGATWSTQSSGTAENLNYVRMFSASDGLACGKNGTVLKYNGSSWSALSTPTTNELLCIDKKKSRIIATNSEGAVIKSDDNGSNWVIINYKIVVKSEVRSVCMIDDDTFYSCGGGGFIRKSTDAGATFSFQSNPMMANLVSMYFFDANKGWAVSSLNNAILNTTNGGTTWSFGTGTTVGYSWSQKRAGSSNIGNGFSLHPFNKNTIFIAMGKIVYRSLNRGENWTIIDTIGFGSRAHTFFVSSVDSNHWIASMDESGGRVVRTTNYGTTWTVTWGPAPLTNYGMPMMADPTTPNQVYLNPDNSVLLKSTNFGLNWSSVGTKVFRSPDNITVALDDPNTIYSGDGVTGSGLAELFKTTNGGINWALVHTVSGSEIPFTVTSTLDPDLSYHSCWSSGGIWKSQNKWNTFTQVATTGSAWAVDIAKDDITAVAYGLYSGTVYHSTNSGSSFTSTSVGSSPEAGMLYYDKGTLFSQKGAGVYKLNINYTVPLSSFTVINVSAIPEAMYNFAGNLNMRDTVMLLVRNSTPPYSLVDSAKSVLDSASLGCSFRFSSLANGTYYLVVKGRNIIETWSKTGGESVTAGSINAYDFRTAASQAYGNNQTQVSSSPVYYGIYSGDVDGDGAVDGTDTGLIDNDAYVYASGYLDTDLTGDGTVDASDYSIADNNSSTYISKVTP